MGRIGPHKQEPIEVKGLARLEATLAIVDKKLTAHGYKVRYDWISSRLLVLRNVLLAVSGVAVFAVLAFVFVKEITKETTTIEAFDVASDLDKDGLTPRVLAKMLYDEMVRIQTVASANVNRKTIAPSAWKLDNSLTIPETKLTVGALFSYVRSQIGWHNQIIDGELVKAGDQLLLRVRVRGKPHATFVGTRDKLDDLMRQAAEHIYLNVEPIVLAIYHRFTGNTKGLIEAGKKASTPSDIDEAAAGLAEWGIALARQGSFESAYEKFKESIRLNPATITAYDGMRVIVARIGKLEEYKEALLSLVKHRPDYAGLLP